MKKCVVSLKRPEVVVFANLFLPLPVEFGMRRKHTTTNLEFFYQRIM